MKILPMVLLFLSGPVLAQEVQKPIYVVGEWCDYLGLKGEKNRRLVTEVKPDGGYTVDYSGRTRVYNADHQLIRSNDTHYTPAWAGLSFPLKPGILSGSGKFSYPHSRGGMVNAETTVKAVTLEKQVKVPAGTFDAIRVDMIVNYRRTANRYSNHFEQSIWFAVNSPVKMYIKSQSIDWGIGNESKVENSLVGCGGP